MKFCLLNRLLLLTILGLLMPPWANSAQLEDYSDDRELAFSLDDLKDNRHALQDYRGKVVLVNFWASWCPPCIHEMPELTRLKQQLADKPFEILAINVAEKKYRVRKFTRLINFYLPVLLDIRSETFNHWGVKTLPTSFLLDKNGNIRYRVRGNPGWESETTRNAINKLLSEPVETR